MTTPTDPAPAVTRSDGDEVATIALQVPGLTPRSRHELLDLVQGAFLAMRPPAFTGR